MAAIVPILAFLARPSTPIDPHALQTYAVINGFLKLQAAGIAVWLERIGEQRAERESRDREAPAQKIARFVTLMFTSSTVAFFITYYSGHSMSYWQCNSLALRECVVGLMLYAVCKMVYRIYENSLRDESFD